jgi:hypothetical protein
MPSTPISAIELSPNSALIAPNDMPPPIIPSDSTEGIVISPATTAQPFMLDLPCHGWVRPCAGGW